MLSLNWDRENYKDLRIIRDIYIVRILSYVLQIYLQIYLYLLLKDLK